MHLSRMTHNGHATTIRCRGLAGLGHCRCDPPDRRERCRFVFTELSNRVLMQIVVSVLGIAIIVAAATTISWYRIKVWNVGGRGRACRH
jgi:hypothetical protein